MRWLILVALVAVGCKSEPPAQTAPSAAAPATAASAPPAGSPVGEATPGSAAPRPGGRWARAVPKEPDPAAKALYRAAMARLAKGDHVGARPLIEQIRRDHPDSRFAARLSAAGGRAGGPIALLAAVAGLLAGAAK